MRRVAARGRDGGATTTGWPAVGRTSAVKPMPANWSRTQSAARRQSPAWAGWALMLGMRSQSMQARLGGGGGFVEMGEDGGEGMRHASNPPCPGAPAKPRCAPACGMGGMPQQTGDAP